MSPSSLNYRVHRWLRDCSDADADPYEHSTGSVTITTAPSPDDEAHHPTEATKEDENELDTAAPGQQVIGSTILPNTTATSQQGRNELATIQHTGARGPHIDRPAHYVTAQSQISPQRGVDDLRDLPVESPLLPPLQQLQMSSGGVPPPIPPRQLRQRVPPTPRLLPQDVQHRRSGREILPAPLLTDLIRDPSRAEVRRRERPPPPDFLPSQVDFDRPISPFRLGEPLIPVPGRRVTWSEDMPRLARWERTSASRSVANRVPTPCPLDRRSRRARERRQEREIERMINGEEEPQQEWSPLE